MIGTNQIDVAQGYLLHFVADVMNAEDGLIPAHTLAPETKQLKPEVQGELGGVRMKRRLFTPNGNQAFQLLERLAVMAQGSASFCSRSSSCHWLRLMDLSRPVCSTRSRSFSVASKLWM